MSVWPALHHTVQGAPACGIGKRGMARLNSGRASHRRMPILLNMLRFLHHSTIHA